MATQMLNTQFLVLEFDRKGREQVASAKRQLDILFLGNHSELQNESRSLERARWWQWLILRARGMIDLEGGNRPFECT